MRRFHPQLPPRDATSRSPRIRTSPPRHTYQNRKHVTQRHVSIPYDSLRKTVLNRIKSRATLSNALILKELCVRTGRPHALELAGS
jgi:hypothetical protein